MNQTDSDNREGTLTDANLLSFSGKRHIRMYISVFELIIISSFKRVEWSCWLIKHLATGGKQQRDPLSSRI